MPFDKMLNDPFVAVWLLASVVILVVGVLIIFCVIAVCYKTVFAKAAPRQSRNKRTTQEAHERAQCAARDAQAKHRIGLQLYQPRIPTTWYI